MIIVRLSAGLANQMMEYAAGYALSRRLNKELVLDISSCILSEWGYLLDEFQIPAHSKIIYDVPDADTRLHEDYRNARKHFPDALILVEKKQTIYPDCKDRVVCYSGISEADKWNNEKRIYLCGYFSDRSSFYKEYWKELIRYFVPRTITKEIVDFKHSIENITSVGVHIRRGDMLAADWATKMTDNYYKAAIVYFQKRFNNCDFYIFSDDLAYAKYILGNDSYLHYVNLTGCDDATVNELYCMSLCDYRVLSNSSTYGRVADDLNYGKERMVVLMDTYGGTTPNDRRIFLHEDEIEELSRDYFVSEDLIRREFVEERYDTFLQLAHEYYFRNCNNERFLSMLSEALIKIGAEKEAILESVKNWNNYRYTSSNESLKSIVDSYKDCKDKVRIVICAGPGRIPSSIFCGITGLIPPFTHMGFSVSLLTTPVTGSDKMYLRNGRFFNARGVDLGFDAWDSEEISISELFSDFSEEIVVIIYENKVEVPNTHGKKVISWCAKDILSEYNEEAMPIKANISSGHNRRIKDAWIHSACKLLENLGI